MPLRFMHHNLNISGRKYNVSIGLFCSVLLEYIIFLTEKGVISVTKDERMLLIGANIRKYRIERHMTQDELSEKAQISTSFCANLERGKKSLSVKVLRDIADALQVTANDLLYEANAESRIASLSSLLSDKPESYIMKIETVIRLFSDTENQVSEKG